MYFMTFLKTPLRILLAKGKNSNPTYIKKRLSFGEAFLNYLNLSFLQPKSAFHLIYVV